MKPFQAAILIVMSSCLVVLFQNCSSGFDAKGSDPATTHTPAITDSEEDSTPIPSSPAGSLSEGKNLDWSTFKNATASFATQFHSQWIIPYAYSASQAIITTPKGFFVYDTSTKTARLFLKNSRENNNFSQPMNFPSLGKIVVLANSFATKKRRLIAVDIISGATTYESPFEINANSLCIFDPADEANGQIMCAIPHPEQAGKRRVLLVNISKNTTTVLRDIPADFTLDLPSSDGAITGFSYYQSGPLPGGRPKALVKTYNTQTEDDKIFLLSADEAIELQDSTVYDFAGNGQEMSYSTFKNSNTIGIGYNSNLFCGGQNFSSLSSGNNGISISVSKHSDGICLANKIWFVATAQNKAVRQCSTPTSCRAIDIEANGLKMGLYPQNAVYLESDKSLLFTANLNTYKGLVLQVINLQTDVKINVDLGAPTIEEEAVEVQNVTVLSSSERRIHNGKVVIPYQVYIPENKKIYPIPAIPGGIDGTIYWQQYRKINTTHFLIGHIVVGPGIQQAVVWNSDNGAAVLDGSLLSQNKLEANEPGSEKILILNSSQMIQEYDLLKREAKNLHQLGADEKAQTSYIYGDFVGLYIYTPIQKFIIYNKGQSVLSQNTNGSVYFMKDYDSTGFYIHITNFITGTVAKFDFANKTLGTAWTITDGNILPVRSPYGLFFMSTSGNVWNANGQQIADKIGNVIGFNIGQTSRYLYFQKGIYYPDDSYVGDVIQLDLSNGTSRVVRSNVANEWSQIIGDMLLSLTYDKFDYSITKATYWKPDGIQKQLKNVSMTTQTTHGMLITTTPTAGSYQRILVWNKDPLLFHTFDVTDYETNSFTVVGQVALWSDIEDFSGDKRLRLLSL